MKKSTKLFIIVTGCILLAIIIMMLVIRMSHEHEKDDGKNGYKTIPSIDDKGKKIDVKEEEIEKINEMIKYANFFYTSEFDSATISDVILANVGFALTNHLQEEVEPENHKLGIPKEVFEDSIYNFFGRNIEKPEKLDTGMISFEDGYYVILPIGFGEEGVYEHRFLTAYDLGDKYIKIICAVDYSLYNALIGEDVFTENAGTAECILKMNPNSSFGYNVIAYRVKIVM